MTDQMDSAECIDRIASLVGLPLNPDHRLGVVANFERIQAIAQLVMEFPLPEEIESAPVFEP